MSFVDLSTASMVDVFLLLLIGVGPKIALLPYLEATGDMAPREARRVAGKMIKTAAGAAVVLLLFGELLSHLLHFSEAALSIAGGIVLLIVAVSMVLGQPGTGNERPHKQVDPMQTAVFPLAIPYLLNPAGIVALVVLSAEANTLALLAWVMGLLTAVFVIDWLVFRWANRVSRRLDSANMLVTEKVFGFLLAALAVQLGITGILSAATTGH